MVHWPSRASQVHLSPIQRGHWRILTRTCAYFVLIFAAMTWLDNGENLALISIVSVVMFLGLRMITANLPDCQVTIFDRRKRQVDQVRGWFGLRKQRETIPFQRIEGLILRGTHIEDLTWACMICFRLVDGTNKGLAPVSDLGEGAEPMIERPMDFTELRRLETKRVQGYEYPGS